jgi:phosphoribosylformylglycinamidine cyclo-ligase
MTSRYEESGVSIENGEELVARLKKKSSLIGGFAGLFPLGNSKGTEPGAGDEDILVACTDGIGTKIEMGLRCKRIRGLGQDLVAMCVNDLVVTGAKPLFFLDYYATSKLDVSAAEEFIDGIRDALAACDTVLLGGETAEMPGFYPSGHFDAAGFSVGIVKRRNLIDGSTIAAGDAIVALPSSGLHSNGFSLVRKIVNDGLVHLDSQAPGEAAGVKWADVLTCPTRLYVKDAIRALGICKVKGMAHITGGGLSNIDRVLPKGLRSAIDAVALRPRPYMLELVKLANISHDEAHQVWNMGTGFVYIVAQSEVSALQTAFADAFVIGAII